ncbi:MAG: hypothetical protein NTV06_03710 [candidate division Zixibacteria bacterium]|nr:hypothetical protein [candidate division Zixibacteria bacterium]
MTENDERKNPQIPDKEIDPDLRYRYLGFEVKPGKIGDLFQSESEKQNWVQRILEKRKAGIKLRETCSLTEIRVAPYERIILTITSVLLVLSLFLPWFSGYREIEVKPKAAAQQEVTPGTSEMADNIQPEAAKKDEMGFTSISTIKKRVEIRREYESASAMGAIFSIGSLGSKVFSSGFILMLSGFLMIIYILLCIGLAAYTLNILYRVKGDADKIALELKRILKWNWLPIGIWAFCMLISFVGADYSFSTVGAMKQVGRSYGISTFLGLLTYGFYISLAALTMNAVKASEI